mgnify:FL=1
MAEKNKVKFGLSNVHVAKMIKGEDGVITYDTPFKIPGAVNLSLDAEGDNEPFYADNIKFFESFANNGYSGELEIAKIPDEFLKEILGQKIDSIGGVLENINDKITPFAFMYQIEGDVTGTRFCYYNATVSRPSTEASTTEDTKTPNTDTLSITTSAREDTGDVRYKLALSDTNKTEYNAFFNTVPEPKDEASV